MDFEEWMSKVDALIENSYGLSSADLPDCPYHDWYIDGIKPSTAAKRAVRSAMAGM